jgi:protein-tyrosine phosphatase
VRTNIGHILNVAVECYNAFPGKFKYKNIDLEDHKHEKIIEKFQEAFEFIHSAKKDGSKILIHCVQGMSRSATIVIAFLMFDSKMTLKEAYGFVKSKRTIIEPNPGFMKQLIEYEFQIHGKNSITISEYVSK